MKKLNTLLIASAAIILMSCGQSNNNTQQVVEENPKVTVTTVNAEYVSQITVYPTTIEADIVNNIAPQSSARISKIYVEIGDKVEAGQVLAKMDEANLEKARLQLVNDSIELGRIKQLHDIGATSQSDFEAMSLKYDVSKRTYLNLLENTLLKSPISGIVTARNYDEGDMYAMAQPLFVIQKISPVKMLINISESKYSQIQKGMEVDITTDAYGDQVFKGVVSLIHPTINAMTHTFPVEVKFMNKDITLRPGMFARVTVNYGDNFRVVIPDRAVMRQVGSGEQYVYILNHDGTVTYSVVELGRRMGNRYEVLSGIDDNATIVVSGQTRLKNGIAVDVVK
ncbi:MAG: efflux RND transporter periplasmic adaptor subunit [Bacteroidales bacterium]|nr:efflux RND transporter periplasmic adaptor subunit [Bacteroidales bacterium]MBO7528742.1 efflux RND transporter periplasmic adaptor subunit [Bacteroidales bacterium]